MDCALRWQRIRSRAIELVPSTTQTGLSGFVAGVATQCTVTHSNHQNLYRSAARKTWHSPAIVLHSLPPLATRCRGSNETAYVSAPMRRRNRDRYFVKYTCYRALATLCYCRSSSPSQFHAATITYVGITDTVELKMCVPSISPQ